MAYEKDTEKKLKEAEERRLKEEREGAYEVARIIEVKFKKVCFAFVVCLQSKSCPKTHARRERKLAAASSSSAGKVRRFL
jgi:hypothetical protein